MLGGESVGEQLSAFHSLAHVLELLQQRLIPLALDQKIERGEDGQTCLDQGEELLVENQEGGLLQLALAPELSLRRR